MSDLCHLTQLLRFSAYGDNVFFVFVFFRYALLSAVLVLSITVSNAAFSASSVYPVRPFISITRINTPQALRFNPQQPKVFGVKFSLREIGRIFFPVKIRTFKL